jgi:threonine dehydratase
MNPSLTEWRRAAATVHAVMPLTPQIRWPLLERRLPCAALWVRHENHTPQGAFEIRGALTCIDRSMRGLQRPRGVAGAAALAAAQADSQRLAGKRVAVEPSGGHIDRPRSASILAKDPR